MTDKEKVFPESEKIENVVAIAVVSLVIVLVIAFANGWWGLFSEESDNPIVTTSINGEPLKGDPNAPVTIVEYSDFECPFCGRWFQQVYPRIKEEYIDTGKANIVFKQFPLTRIHPNALDAAIASECAYQQGNEQFWRYHDVLFNNQGNLSIEKLKAYAQEAGLNQLQFDLCLSNRNTQPEVEQDLQEGVQAGITGTPGFVVGESGLYVKGELIIGAHPFSKFQEAISRI